MASAQILTNGKALYAYNGTEWVPLNTAGNLVNSTRWQKTTTAAQTSLSGNDDYGDSLIYTPGYEQLYLNGVLLARDVDYTATNGTTITGLAPLTAGHIIEVIAYNNINVGNTYTQAQIDSKVANTFERWVDTLSASATVLSGLDDNSNTLSYTPGLEQVYVNGILLLPSEYTATSGSSIVLSEAAVASDVIQVYALKNFRVPNTYTILQTDDQFLTKTSASSTYLSQSSASTTYAPVAAGGLVQLVPTSIAATGGSGSISSTGAVSLTSASAISLNGCFTTTYDNYRIIFNTTLSADADLTFKYRNSGTDTSAAYYSYNHSMFPIAGTQGAGTRTNNGTFIAFNGGLGTLNYVVDIRNPFVSGRQKYLNAQGISSALASIHQTGGTLDNTNQFDGFTLAPQSGTITGTITIYGYKK